MSTSNLFTQINSTTKEKNSHVIIVFPQHPGLRGRPGCQLTGTRATTAREGPSRTGAGRGQIFPTDERTETEGRQREAEQGRGGAAEGDGEGEGSSEGGDGHSEL